MDAKAFDRMWAGIRNTGLFLLFICGALAVVLLIGLVQTDDAQAEAEARAWASGWHQGYDAGLQQRGLSVADAYQLGMRDAQRDQAAGLPATAASEAQP